ncbi:MAG: diaminopimelate epimerase [Gammaproteobacteria bacterium]|nr:MAG: diaminopimelate epimerase [Gammaproteobacteria bacterium]
MELEILLCHGSSNYFILIDESRHEFMVFDKKLRSKLTILLCQDASLKSDGVLFYRDGDDATYNNAHMDMYNPDGSSALMCGNGLRCVTRYCYEKTHAKKMTISTALTNHRCYMDDEIYPGVVTASVQVTPINIESCKVPMITNHKIFMDMKLDDISPDFKFSAIAVPNPHLISITDKIDGKILEKIGKNVNNSAIFPQGINYSMVKIINPTTIFVATYERGVGITKSCGTAMSASSFIYSYLQQQKQKIKIIVKNNGGMVKCEVFLSPKFEIILTGNATFYQKNTISIDFLSSKITTKTNNKNLNEINSYQQFIKSL